MFGKKVHVIYLPVKINLIWQNLITFYYVTLLYDVRSEYGWVIKLQTIEVKKKEGIKTCQTTRSRFSSIFNVAFCHFHKSGNLDYTFVEILDSRYTECGNDNYWIINGTHVRTKPDTTEPK